MNKTDETQKILTELRASGLSVEEIAVVLDKTAACIQNWIHGRTTPDKANLDVLCGLHRRRCAEKKS